jgi:alkylated DNA repair dioxygenase AlkB
MRQPELFPRAAPPRGALPSQGEGEKPSTAAVDVQAVPGFTLLEDWIDEGEERRLLEAVDAGSWSSDWRRRVQIYGLGYGGDDELASDLRTRARARPRWVGDLPAWVRPLAARVLAEGHLPRFAENVVVNEYLPGVGIGAHRDDPAFGPRVACVSLAADVILDLSHAGDGRRVSIDVPARSLWVMTGEARTSWKHAIAARKSDVVGGLRRARRRRISITFRTARGERPPPGVIQGVLRER